MPAILTLGGASIFAIAFLCKFFLAIRGECVRRDVCMLVRLDATEQSAPVPHTDRSATPAVATNAAAVAHASTESTSYRPFRAA